MAEIIQFEPRRPATHAIQNVNESRLNMFLTWIKKLPQPPMSEVQRKQREEEDLDDMHSGHYGVIVGDSIK